MIRINLLPFRQARKQENLRQQLIVFFIILIGMVGGLFYLHLHFKGKIEELTAKIDKTKKELDKQNKIANEVEAYQKQLAELKRKLDVIDVLDSNKKDIFTVLDKLTDRVVKSRMWFTNLKTKENVRKKKGEADVKVMEISVEGIAMDQTTVADFISNLEAEEMFVSVSLGGIKKVKLKQGLELQQFRLTFHRRPLVKPKVEEQTKDTKDTKKAKKKK